MPTRNSRLSIADALTQLLDKTQPTAYATTRLLAEKLGVSERSIRRWKNEGKTPHVAGVEGKIKERAREQQRSIARREKTQGVPKLPEVKSVRVQGYRKRLRTGDLSRTVSYNVSGLSQAQQADILTDIWRSRLYEKLFVVVDFRATYPNQKIENPRTIRNNGFRIPDAFNMEHNKIDDLLLEFAMKGWKGYTFKEFSLTIKNTATTKRKKKR